MSVTEPVKARPSEPVGGERSRATSLTGASIRLVIAVCFAISLVLLALPSAPSIDAWSWLVWGRELAGLDLNTGSGSSVMVAWKPLPVLITAILSPFGDLAPELWLMVVRAASLLALALAYRLGARLAGPVGGVVAALGLLLTPGWVGWSLTGASEPLLAALVLWAVERHLDGHRGQAFVLGFLVALARPEAWPLLALYGTVAWRFEPRVLLRLAAAGAALLFLWFGIDWLASGSPATATTRATGVDGGPALVDLGSRLRVLLAPVWVMALAGGVMAARDAGAARGSKDDRRLPPPEARITLVLGAGALAWIAIVVAMTVVGYSALPRFLVPAGAVLCVVAGVGAARLLKAIAASRAAAPVLVPVLLGVLLLAVPPLIARIAAIPSRATHPEYASRIADVRGSVQAGGGPDRLLACGSIGSADPYMQGVLAWELGVHLEEVHVLLEKADIGHLDVAVVVADDRLSAVRSTSDSPPRPRVEPLGRSGDWSVFAVHQRPAARGAAKAAGIAKPGPGCPTSSPSDET